MYLRPAYAINDDWPRLDNAISLLMHRTPLLPSINRGMGWKNPMWDSEVPTITSALPPAASQTRMDRQDRNGYMTVGQSRSNGVDYFAYR